MCIDRSRRLKMNSDAFTDDEVRAIRNQFKLKEKTVKELAQIHNIGERSIRNLLNGYTYGHVEGAFKLTKRENGYLNEETKTRIVELYLKYHSQYKVEQLTGISRNTISKYLKKAGVACDGKFYANKNIPDIMVNNFDREKEHALSQKTLKEKPKLKPKPKIEYKPSIAISDKKLATLLRLYHSKWGVQEIAHMLNISVKDTNYYIKQHEDAK